MQRRIFITTVNEIMCKDFARNRQIPQERGWGVGEKQQNGYYLFCLKACKILIEQVIYDSKI